MRPRARLRAAAAFTAVVALIAAVPVAFRVADAADPGGCSSNYAVNEVMANGARWQFCWEVRDREGMVLHHVRYTPPGGSPPIEILGQAALAEIHVPYDTGSPRFFDLSGIGVGSSMVDLDEAECPDGTRLSDRGREVVCQQTLPNAYAYKHEAAGAHGQSTSLRFFTVAEMGAYNYIVAWNFDDDGTIRPEVGSAGALQMVGGPRWATWPVGPGDSRRAVAHMHNFYWRLDFDIDGTPTNDRVQELEAVPPSGARGQRRNTRLGIRNEVKRRVFPARFRTWRIRDLAVQNDDGHDIGVDLLPDTDHVYRGPGSELFTRNDVYVTQRRPCEVLAAGNVGPNCGDDVADYVNGASLIDKDLVVWYGTSFHHLPRDEDDPHMHPHWSGFAIVPRGLTAQNPTVS